MIRRPGKVQPIRREKSPLELTAKQTPSGMDRAENDLLSVSRSEPRWLQRVLESGLSLPLLVEPEQIDASQATALQRGDFVHIGDTVAGDYIPAEVSSVGRMMRQRITPESSKYIQVIVVKPLSAAARKRYEDLREQQRAKREQAMDHMMNS